MDKEAAQILADAIGALAQATRDLGTGNAATDMGALEFLAIEFRDGTTRMAAAISDLAEAVREAR